MRGKQTVICTHPLDSSCARLVRDLTPRSKRWKARGRSPVFASTHRTARTTRKSRTSPVFEPSPERPARRTSRRLRRMEKEGEIRGKLHHVALHSTRSMLVSPMEWLTITIKYIYFEKSTWVSDAALEPSNCHRQTSSIMNLCGDQARPGSLQAQGMTRCDFG